MPDYNIPSGPTASYPGDSSDYNYSDYASTGGDWWVSLINTGIEQTPGLISAIGNAVNGTSPTVIQPGNMPYGYQFQNQNQNNTLLYVGVGVVVLIILVAVILLATRK